MAIELFVRNLTISCSRGLFRPSRRTRAVGLTCLIASVLVGEFPQGASALTFRCVQLASQSGKGTFAVAAADLDDDGRTDLVASHSVSGTISAFRQTASGSFAESKPREVGEVPRGVVVSDYNTDGILDLAVANASSHDVALLTGDGRGEFAGRTSLRAGMAPFQLIADAARLIVVNESNWSDTSRPGFVDVFAEKPTGLEPIQRLRAGSYPADALLRELDGRAGADLLVANWYSADLSLFSSEAGGRFGAAVSIPIPGSGPIYGVGAGDFDGDGVDEIVATDLAGRVHVLVRNTPTKWRREHSLDAAGRGTRDVAVGDLNADGYLDLVTADQASDSLSIWRGRAQGKFDEAVAVAVGRRPRSVLVEDIDGDGKLDLVAANQGGPALTVLFSTIGQDMPCPASGGHN